MITGFLGAGKTSFIRAMARGCGRQFVILENEYGSLDVDGSLLMQDKEVTDEKIWEMSEGCICCTLKQNFAQTVMSIHGALDPDYLIVEPSGVAMPSRILQELSRICYDRISLAAPIAVIDGQHFEKTIRDYPEYYRDQISIAGTVAVSKSESFTVPQFQSIADRLEIRPDTVFPPVHYSEWPPAFWQSLLEKTFEFEKDENGGLKRVFGTEEKTPQEELESLSMEGVMMHSPERLLAVMELLVRGAFGTVTRAKGFLRCPERWYRFDLVDGDYAVTGCEEMEEGRAVVIGKDLKRGNIRRAFQQLYVPEGSEIQVAPTKINPGALRMRR